jgi:hypothetical protein
VSNWGPATAPTKEEHDAIVAMRGRPYTADPMREARPVDVHDTSSPSLIDNYIQPKGDTQ